MIGPPEYDCKDMDLAHAGQRIAELEKQNVDMLAMLEELEWSDEAWMCPCCRGDEEDGHAKDCTLGNLLKRVRKGEE